MTIQEQAQEKIDKENLESKIASAKYRLERIVTLEKEIATLKDELAKIEDGTFVGDKPLWYTTTQTIGCNKLSVNI